MRQAYSVNETHATLHFQGYKNRPVIDVLIDADVAERMDREIKRVSIRWDGPRRPVWRIIVVDTDGNKIYLPRWITNSPTGTVVDHINHNTLDNRRENLRVVSFGENSWNRKGADVDSKTGIRNVNPCKDRMAWAVDFRVNGQTIHAGRFSTIEEASQTADLIRDDVYRGTWEKPERITARGQNLATINRKIHERDNHCCIICNCYVDDGIKFHHAVFKSHGGNDTVENGVTLCMDCHTKVHGRVGCQDNEVQEFRQKIEDYLEALYGSVTE